jgi:hypothetical protein
MSALNEAVAQAAAGDAIDPAYLKDEPVDQMASRYAEIFHYFAEQTPFIRPSNGVILCTKCGGRVIKLIAKVPGAVRFDGCCSNCGEDEFHTAGWSNDEAGNEARASVRKAVTA